MKKFSLLIAFLIISLISFSQKYVIYFEQDKAVISSEQIDELENLIKEKDIHNLTLFGYADKLASNDYNKELVEKRLNAVKDEVLKVDSNVKITTKNYGEEKSSSSIDKEYRKVVIKFEEKNYSLREPRYNKSESFKIDNSRDTIIKCKKGTKIYIPSHSFVLKEGKNLSTNRVDFRVTEYYSPAEMIEANLTTKSDDRILETGGMLHIEAFSGGRKLALKEDKKLGLKFKDISFKDSMKLFSGKISNNQINWELEDEKQQTKPLVTSDYYIRVEDMPEFQGGGISKFKEFIHSNLSYPKIAFENKIEGTVWIRFLIDKEGFIKDPKIMQSVHPSMSFEAIRKIATAPRWEPGRKNKTPVNVQFSIPVRFDLDSEIPIDDDNMINDSSQIQKQLEIDSLYSTQIKSMELLTSFKMLADSIGWFNCDRFSPLGNYPGLKIKVNSRQADIYAIFNNNRSIIKTDFYNEKKQIMGFSNLPREEEIKVVGLKLVNNQTYFFHNSLYPSDNLLNPKWRKIDKKELTKKLRQIGIK